MKHALGCSETLAYGSESFAEMMVFCPANTFMVFFYTDVAGIAAATIGTLMLFSRVFDLLNPVMGVVVDRSRSRYGKASSWLLWMAVPFGISAVLLFTAPSLGHVGKVTYAFVTYILAMTIIYPLIDVLFAALLPLITRDQQKRTNLSLSHMIQCQFGGLVCYAVTLPMVAFFGGGAHGWQRAFVVFGVVATVLLLATFFSTKERVNPISVKRGQVPIRSAVTSLACNKYWLMMALVIVCQLGLMGLFADSVYYCRYYLHDVKRFGPLMSVFQGLQVVGMFVAGPAIKKLGKRNTALAGMGVSIPGQLIMLVLPSSYGAALLGTALKALGSAPVVSTVFALIANTLEYGEWKFGVRAEGFAFGAITLVVKISVGLGNALVGRVLGIAGYVNGIETQSDPVLLAIKIMFLHLPLVGLLATAILLSLYKLDEQYATIAAELNLRRDAAVLLRN